MPSYNDKWEDEILKVISKETKYIKDRLTPDLEEYRRSSSVISDSINTIENYNNSFDDNSNGMEQTKNKTLVRTMGSPYSMPSGPVLKTDDSSNQYYGESNNTVQQNSNMGGATLLVLACTAILVLLVFLVSFYIMNGLGF